MRDRTKNAAHKGGKRFFSFAVKRDSYGFLVLNKIKNYKNKDEIFKNEKKKRQMERNTQKGGISARAEYI